ncbi:acetylglutamate kinase n-acetyl-gamma-glutamyl-phosphate reductase precursor (ARG-6) [Fusarium circinatum]|uniref:Acetylglutamate kinase n-acetyl-gamma-glutamyl-phosphate reductase (ARG-6) n=1 Tax=Fusarium circinatum TaxID=48490 RepID=A0A8H5UH05_FUSCI|nr:acetylglutamate kinase n-acetyl-gamma-glutamyl-phosphate reductase precursor (ARG-6) [Fusarium circinatum]
MLPAAAVVLRTSVHLATHRTLTHVSAPALTSFRCLNRALSTTHALAAASSLNRDRAREIVAQTISNIESKRETAAYLKVFTLTSQHFAVIKVGGAILQEHLDEFCGSILLLYDLGLYPVIVHGADSFGVATRSIQGAFGASYLDKDKWGYVGKVTEVRKQAIESSILAGYIPILTSMAEGDDGHLLNVNVDVAAAELARALKPLKVIYLSEKGGLFDGEGKLISQINLDDEFDSLMAQPWCRYGTRLKIVQCHDLLNSLPRSSSVAIIHPGNLQKELFTDSGAGTLIRLGNSIQKTSSIKELKVIKQLEARSDSSSDNLDIPAIVDQFASALTEKKFTAYYDDAMHCMAIIMPQDQGMAILTSLSTTKSGWLNGTMENIFTNIRKDFPTLAWAVSERDENLTWFFEQADGSFHENGRVLFYYGSDMRSVALSSVYENFVSGRASLGDSNLESGGTA